MLRIFNDRETLSRGAASALIMSADQAIAERGRFLVVLNGGGTPGRLFELLATIPHKMDWARTHVFWGDERCVPANDPESNYGTAKRILLDSVPIPADNIHRIDTDLAPAEAVADFTRTLKQFATPPLDWPRFDLILLGMGDDGHTASLFPGSDLNVTEPVITVNADYQGRPAQRITLTLPVFNSAREILFLVTGASKAETLRRILHDDSAVQYPAAHIRPNDGMVTWFADEAAAEKL